MRIGVALEIDSSIGHLSAAVQSIDAKLAQCFSNRQYGVGVENIFIGLILMAFDSDRLHPVRPVKYRKRVKVKNMVTGLSTEMHNVIEYDVRPIFETVSSMSVRDAERYLSTALMESLTLLEAHLHLFPNFDLRKFRNDFASCLRPLDSRAGEKGPE